MMPRLLKAKDQATKDESVEYERIETSKERLSEVKNMLDKLKNVEQMNDVTRSAKTSDEEKLTEKTSDEEKLTEVSSVKKELTEEAAYLESRIEEMGEKLQHWAQKGTRLVSEVKVSSETAVQPKNAETVESSGKLQSWSWFIKLMKFLIQRKFPMLVK
ncbi:hypothetical protein CROQUDRAFT_189337 [Cronartium quercuum f. sp. fusiforme G11]|uniref:Uncharacterized protein n=1 Tax=Cronartium quercuum f. sp. fusiforme G11 TaxID=708437 RepID=A0A9P6T8M9_9BASI|nr:hypothetical protein CROQUDRAFT_189337 [Cronartium quercuum f. sp. fusiforme G11]